MRWPQNFFNYLGFSDVRVTMTHRQETAGIPFSWLMERKQLKRAFDPSLLTEVVHE